MNKAQCFLRRSIFIEKYAFFMRVSTTGDIILYVVLNCMTFSLDTDQKYGKLGKEGAARLFHRQ